MTRALAIAAVLAATGCGKELNPEYCARHPNDGDCRGADLVKVDAPAGCMSSAMCTTDPVNHVCELSTGNCVQCVPDIDSTACTGATAVCGEDRQCHGCIVDTNCMSNVCLPDGTCATASDVIYASPNGTAGNTTECSSDKPCKLTEAVAQLGATRRTLKLTTTAGVDYTAPAITISVPALIIGTGTTFHVMGPGVGITVRADVQIVGLTVEGADVDGIACATGGKLGLSRVTVTGSKGWGVTTTGCEATIERSRFTLNVEGGIELGAGTHEVRNNIIDHNGNKDLIDGNVHVVGGAGRFMFNTLAENKSKGGGGGKTGGVKCQGTMTIAHNILVANGPGADFTLQGCTERSNATSDSLAAIHFAGTGNYHLTAQSPLTGPTVREDPDAEADCRINATTYIDDFDGQPRPYQLCDRGADEYRP